ncbi:MAG: NYN domain-containing protein, partial [Acidimicrobiales bacterium]
AEQSADQAQGRARDATSALAEERRLRRAAEQAVAELSSRLSTSTSTAQTAVAQATAAASQLATLQVEHAALRAEHAVATARLADAASVPGDHPGPGAVNDALAPIRAVANQLEAALAHAEERLAGPGGVGGAESPVDRAPAPASRSRSRSRSSGPRRRPAPLPPAVFDDSPEAAAHLVRVPGAVLLVDGYNAAMSMWPGLDVTDVRTRLIDALRELSARTGIAAHVVFDGDEVGGPVLAAGGRSSVRVSFSPPGVEADDVILEMVDALPAVQPVIVASSDRRVQDGARDRGANVVTSRQLADLLGR